MIHRAKLTFVFKKKPKKWTCPHFTTNEKVDMSTFILAQTPFVDDPFCIIMTTKLLPLWTRVTTGSARHKWNWMKNPPAHYMNLAWGQSRFCLVTFSHTCQAAPQSIHAAVKQQLKACRKLWRQHAKHLTYLFLLLLHRIRTRCSLILHHHHHRHLLGQPR